MINLIDELRKAIDGLDEKILNLLSKRKNLAKEVAKLKENLDLPVFDKKREEEILKNISGRAKQLGLDVNSVSDVFNAIFRGSRSEQQKQMGKVECSVKKIGLIGFGRFGKLIVRHLSGDFDFYVYDRLANKNEIKNNNAVPSSLKELCRLDIIILAVPISEIKSVLNDIKNLLKKDALVVDVCSVKEYPIKLMKNILPKSVQILGTHSMFGPDTAYDSLEEKKIVLCKVRIQNNLYLQIKRFLESKQLAVIEATAQQHDAEMAKSLVLTHFIGRALMDIGVSDMEIDTKSYRDLLRILDTVKNDTWQLFEDMNKFNKYSKGERKDLIKSLSNVEKKLSK